MKRIMLFTVITFVCCLLAVNGYCLEDWKDLGLYGGMLEQIVIDASNTSNHYAYTRIDSPAGVYKSTVPASAADAGSVTWTKLDSFPTSTATSLGATQDESCVLATTTESMYSSTNGGASWTAISGIYNGSIIVVDSANGILVGANDTSDINKRNLFYSSDHGGSWTALLTTPLDTISQLRDLIISTDRTIIWGLVRDSATLYRWTQSGGSWSQSEFTEWGEVLDGFSPTTVTIDPNDNNKVYIGDGSGHLVQTLNGTDSSPTFTQVASIGAQGGNGKVYISSDSSTCYKAGKKSTDAFATITSIPNPSAGLNVNNVLCIHPGIDNTVYINTDQGIAVSVDNCLNLTEIDNGISAVVVKDGIQDPSNNDILLIASKSGIGRTADDGDTWSFVKWGAPWLSLAVNSDGTAIYAGDNAGKVSYSTDHGATWTDSDSQNQVEGNVTSPQVNKIFLDPVDQNIIYAAIAATGDYTTGCLYTINYSDLPAGSWTNLLPDYTTPATCISGYAAGGTSILLLGYGDLSDGSVGGGLKRSADGGTTWTDISYLTGYDVQCIAVDPNTSTTLYLGTGHNQTNVVRDNSGTIFKSTDGGAIWTDLSPNDGNHGPFTSITVDPDDSTKIYAACNNIVYASLDSGTTWYEYYIAGPGESFYSLFMFAGIGTSPAAARANTGPALANDTDYSLVLGSQAGLYLWGSSTDWYFGEGCTASGFDTWLLMSNPGATTATATVTYITPDTSSEQQYTISPTSRYSIHVNEVDGLSSTDVSMKIASDVSITCERAMYWNSMAKGHDTIGVTSPSVVWYLAEGCTENFDQYILLSNFNSIEARVALTFMKTDSTTQIYNTTVSGNRRKTVYANNEIPDAHFSTKVDSDLPIVAERAMYWNEMSGGHCTVGTTSASSEWYLTEGYTGGTYDTWVLIQNPGSSSAVCNVTFYVNGGDPVEREYTIGANSRYSIHVDDILADAEVSTYITAGTSQVIAERAMYWGGDSGDGSCSIGVKSLGTTWYLAEGSTDQYQEYVLIMNPNGSQAAVNASYLLANGTTVNKSYTIEATSRYTIHLNGIAELANTAVSTSITSSLPVAVERAMYFGDSGGHVSIGQKQ